MQLADPPIGILLVLALSSIAVYGIMLAGWSSGSKYPLLGAVRASAQMISYEAALGLSVAAVLLSSGTLSTSGIVLEQQSLSDWNLVATGIVPFVVFMIAATAELNRPPFDLVEAEQELVGGFNTEYAAFGFALFFLAEFMNTITMSAIIVTLFLGGPQPLDRRLDGRHPADPRTASRARSGSSLKTFIFLYVYVWLRATLPRLRYDQLMDLGWKVLIPDLARLVPAARGHPPRRRQRLEPGARGGRHASPAWPCRPALLLARPARQRSQPRTGRSPELMGYLEGFGVTLRQHRLFGGKRLTKNYSGGRMARKELAGRKHGRTRRRAGRARRPRRRQEPQARPPARPPRPQPLRGRHGEVHRLRAVRRRLPGQVHLRARRRQRSRTSPTSPGERFGFVYEINYLRCIHCDLCVEACPTEAITESKVFEFSFTNRQDAIYTKTELLVDDDGRPRHMPWEDWREGEDAKTSGWVRATAPSGDADFVGLVGWSGELGYGVRAPEEPAP